MQLGTATWSKTASAMRATSSAISTFWASPMMKMRMPAEDRPSEVRNYRGLFRPPLIPDIDALSENFEMLCIGHELRSPPVHLTANSRHSWRDESNWAEIGANPAVSPARRAVEYLDEDVEHTRLTRSWDGYVPADSVLVRGYHSINLN